MPDVFLSYKRDDLKAASRLIEALRGVGMDVWWDRDIPAGAPWEATIERELAASKVVLVCWSKAAVASENVRSEARWARDEGRLIQLFLESCNPPLFFGERQGVDLANWRGEASDPKFRQVVLSLRTMLDDGVAPAGGSASIPSGPQPSVRRWAMRPALWISVAAVAVVAGALAMWLNLHGAAAGHDAGASPQAPSGAQQPLRVAVPRFDAVDPADAELGKFTGGLQAEMADQLEQNGITVAAPGPAANPAEPAAAYDFRGTVERQGEGLVARVQLNDVRQHVAVWSGSYAGAIRSAGVLQDEIAAETALVAAVAVSFEPPSRDDTETMSLEIKGALYAFRNRDEERESEWETAKLLLAKLPQSSFSHSNFAIVSLFLAAISTPERAAELRATAVREANAALQLNRHDAVAYLVRSLLFPMVGHWREREGQIQAGLKASPDSAALTTHQSNLLREVGRLQDALSFGRQAAAPQPPTPNRTSTLLIALAETRRFGEASPLVDTLARASPTHPAAWNGRLQALIHQHRWTDALALFGPSAYRPVNVGEDDSRAWTAALEAMASGDPAAKRNAARLLAALPAKPSSASKPPHLVYSPADQIGMLAILGANDEAFARAGDYLQKDSTADSSVLFWPDLVAFRRDKRFWPLVSGIGLVDYWRNTGKWPDFCSEPGLPYDCRTAR